MGFSGVMLALTAVSAVSQISQGYAQKSENQYNRTLLEGKANMIDAQSEIESGQYDRLKAQHMATSTANVAKAGIALEGSALAVITESQKQINVDQAISKLNYQQEKNYTNAEAQAQNRAGSQAVRSGYSGGLSTMLSGVSNYAMYNNPLAKKESIYSKRANTKNLTFSG